MQVPSLSSKPSDLQETLLGMADRFAMAVQRHDAAAIAATLAPEFIYVGPHGVGSREAVVRTLSTQCELKNYKLSDPKLISTGPEAAVLVYKIHQDMTCFGHSESPDVLNTDTFVQRGGTWVFVLTTSTVLAVN